jgi:hypothetical protein
VFTVVYREHKTKKDIRHFSFQGNVHKVLIGDSHIANGIDDSLLKNTKNIAFGGEGLIYSFNKIRILNENNQKLDTIYLGISYHTFSSYFDERIFDHFFVDQYFYSLPFSLQKKLLVNMKDPATFFLRNAIRNFKDIVLNDVNLEESMGGYQNYATDVKISDEVVSNRINAQYYFDGEERGFSKFNIEYFREIVEYCKIQNIYLLVVQTPLHSIYEGKVPDKFKENFYLLIEQSHLEIIDFKTIKLRDDDFLPDGDHVSQKGAKVISQYLSTYQVN